MKDAFTALKDHQLLILEAYDYRILHKFLYTEDRDKVGYFGFGSAFFRRFTRFWKLDTKRLEYKKNIAAFELNKTSSSYKKINYLSGSKLGSILSLLIKANEKWEGNSVDVTPW